MRETFPAVGDAIDKFAKWSEEIGWVTTAAGILAGFLARALLGSIIGLFRPLIGLGFWIVVAFAKTLWWAGGKALVTYLGALAAKHLPKVMKAFRALTVLMLKNPYVAIAAATLALAFLIYQNWEQILGFFRGVWANIKTIWQGAKKWFTDLWQGIMDAFGVDAWIVTLEGYQEKVFGAVTGWFSGISEWIAREWAAITDVLPDWVKEQLGIGDVTVTAAPGDDGPRARRNRGAGPAAVPSLFEPGAGSTEDSPGGARGRLGRSGKASVTVDFRNMPRGTRTETRADSDTDLEVTTGYAMQSAF